MKRLWLCLVSALLLVACSNEIPEVPAQKKSERTMLAYLVAQVDNPGIDLGRLLRQNVVDMYVGLASSAKPSTLLVYYRPGYNDPLVESERGGESAVLSGPSLLKFDFDGKRSINGKPVLSQTELSAHRVFEQAEIHPYKESNHIATSPATMTQIFRDMVKMSPSESYGLVFGSHGTGWMPGHSVETKSFGEDRGYSIDIPVLAEVLKTVFAKGDLEFILFDACMMAATEVFYELRDVTNYCVGSVMETPIDGFPYKSIMPTFYQNVVDYKKICDEFISHNETSPTAGWGTVAAVDCSKMQMLADWVKEALANTYPQWQGDYFEKVQQYGHGHFKYFSFDVVDFFRQLNGEAPSDLLQIMNQVVIAKNCLSGPEHKFGNLEIEGDKFCGIGMYIPYLFSSETYRKNWDEYYESSIAWYNAVEWMNYRP